MASTGVDGLLETTRGERGVHASRKAWRGGGAPRVLATAGAALVPWTLVLARTLPATYEARNWSTAWVGLDAAMAACALGSALLVRAGDPRAALLAAATSTTALVDVWFDVTTSAPGWPLAQALACGVIEVGFAGYCARVALAALG